MTNSGVLLGTEYCARHRASRAFIDRDGHDTIFRVPGNATLDTEPSGISNDARYIVLVTQHSFVGRFTSYLRANGNLHKLSDPKAGKQGTDVLAVNNHKEIVGLYFTGRGSTHFHGFIDRHGKFRTLHLKVKAAVNEAIVDVNDNGDLAGYYQDRHGVYHGFVITGHTTRVINAPGAGHGRRLGTLVLSLADDGTFCGNVLVRRGAVTKQTVKGFITTSGRYRTIQVPSSFGGHDTGAATCNSAGDVAGFYVLNEPGGGWQDVGYKATVSR
jgi:hypothetical protein